MGVGNTRSFRTEIYAKKVDGEKILVGWVDWNVPRDIPDTYIATNMVSMEDKLIESFISFEAMEIVNDLNYEFPKQLSFLDIIKDK